MNIRESYDAAANAYAEHLNDELRHKPLDRHLLNRFAEVTRGRGLVAELGCGPGQVARYLHDQGVETVGLDLSPAMIDAATGLHPGLDFRVGDMKQLEIADATLAGVVSFYSIVHFAPSELGAVFQEMRRVLLPGALALVAFHIGARTVHVEELFGAKVALDFWFHEPSEVTGSLHTAGLDVIERVEREPYGG